MKKVIVFASIMVGAYVACADVLYWMVGDEYMDGAIAQGDNTAATLYYVYQGTAHELEAVTGNDVNDYKSSSFDTALGGYKGDGYSYYIELWNGRKTDSIDYDTALNTYILPAGGMSVPTPTLLNGGFGSGNTAYNVPEPTSGLLFLVGGMLLGLRRKRRV